jgi:hypothetical protein
MRHKPCKCPRCAYEVDAASGLTSDDAPSPGDIALCLNCGAINVYLDGLQIRKSSNTEEQAVLRSSQGPMVARARAEIQKRGFIPEIRGRNKKP